MSLPLTFRPIAEEEFDDAAAWYEGQRPGLGAEFVAAVQQVLDEIAARPGRFPAESGDTREAPSTAVPLLRLLPHPARSGGCDRSSAHIPRPGGLAIPQLKSDA